MDHRPGPPVYRRFDKAVTVRMDPGKREKDAARNDISRIVVQRFNHRISLIYNLRPVRRPAVDGIE